MWRPCRRRELENGAQAHDGGELEDEQDHPRGGGVRGGAPAAGG